METATSGGPLQSTTAKLFKERITEPVNDTEEETNVPHPRELEEASQLIGLREREGGGRVPVLDALAGIVVNDLLDEYEEDGGDKAQWAAELKARMNQKINEIAPLSTGD